MPASDDHTPSLRVLRISAATIVVFGAAYLLLGPKPWVAGLSAAEAAGEKLRTENYRVTGTWFGALANVILAAGVLLLARWFTGPTEKPEAGDLQIENDSSAGRWRMFTLLSVLAAILVTCTGAGPRLGYGLWDDEDRAVRNSVVGQYRVSGSSGEFKYNAVSWEEATYDYVVPNHVLWAQSAKLIHSLWPPAKSPTEDHINEAAVRLPNFIAGLLGLAMLALLLSELGFKRAAIIAPLLLCVHPWYLRYSSEARGYGMLFFFAPLCAWLLIRALRSGQWRFWAGLALAQFLMVYTVLNSLYFLLFLNLAAIVWIWRASQAKATLCRRWILANVATAGLGCLFMLALAPQFLTYMENNTGSAHKFDERLLKDNFGAYATGVRYQYFNDDSSPSLKVLLEKKNPVGVGLLLAAVGAGAIAGAVHLLRKGARGWALLAVFLLPAPVFYLNAWMKGALIFYWYTIIGLPFFWALISIGSGRLASRIEARWLTGRGALASLLVGGAFAVLLFWASYPQRAFQLTRPIEQVKESVALTRTILDPMHPEYDDVMVIGFARFCAYEGFKYRAKDFGEFKQYLREADTSDKPLFVNYVDPGRAKKRHPKMFKLIGDPQYFELVKHLPGVDPGTDREVRRYIRGSFSAKDSG